MLRILPFLLMLAGCTGLPESVWPVKPFEVERYLGTWYEIARLDHSFERGMSEVKAHYALNDDGTLKVVNSGFSEKKGWSSAEAVAKFAGESDVGHLEVSFFRPFWGSYVVFGLDREHYQYAFVTGANKEYLWLLARTPQVDKSLKQQFIENAQSLGYDVNALIWVDQTQNLFEHYKNK